MALHEQNRMLQILHKNGVSRDHVKKIMDDLKESGIFDENELEDDVDWETVNQKAEIWFSDMEPQEKLEAITHINAVVPEPQSTKQRNKFFSDSEKRIRAKMKEMEERGLTGPDEDDAIETEEIIEQPITRYGRSPLHEAIAMRDITLVKKYVKECLYLTILDNNGHTPMEMAYYEGYKEAMIVFDSCRKRK